MVRYENVVITHIPLIELLSQEKTIDNVTHIIYGHNLSVLGYDDN